MTTNAAFSLTPKFSPVRFSSRGEFSKFRRTTCSLSEKAPVVEKSATDGVTDVKFSSWAKENGVDMSSLSLTQFSGTGKRKGQAQRGMVAEKPLKTGQSLISVARGTTLEVTSLDRKRTRLPTKISQSTWQKLPWYARLGLLILDAKKGKDNSLQQWISRLPSYFDTPFHWSDSELSELQNPQLVMAVREQRKHYRRQFDEINGNAENQMARHMNFDEFVWAVECVRSRAFSGPLEVAPFSERLRLFLFIAANTLAWPSLNVIPWENALNGGLTALFALAVYDIIFPRVMRVVQGVQLKRYAMTPGIDFFNHKSSVTGRAEVSFEYFRNKFIVQAGEDYEPGSQAYISYGAQSNDSFLQYYGFVEEHNPADAYVFGEEFEKVLGVPAGRLVVRKNGFDNVTLSAVMKQLGDKKEDALVALAELCDAELKTMSTTLEEDVSLLEDGKVRSNARVELAVRYRKEKKVLLRDAMKTLV